VENRFQSLPFKCNLQRYITVSDVIERHGLSADGGGGETPGGVGLLKVDVERAELAVLRGVAPRDWPAIRQVAIEVHDSAGGTKELAAVRELLVGVVGGHTS
jgi:hypothetical protein